MRLLRLCYLVKYYSSRFPLGDQKELNYIIISHYRLKESCISRLKEYYFLDPPKEAEKAIEHFGLVEGMEGRVPVTIEANPQPVVIWTIGQESVHERLTSGRYTVLETRQLVSINIISLILEEKLLNISIFSLSCRFLNIKIKISYLNKY